MARDYFAAMQRVEQRLDTSTLLSASIVPVEQRDIMGDVKVQELFQLIERLQVPELCYEERLDIACQLRQTFGKANEHAPPVEHTK